LKQNAAKFAKAIHNFFNGFLTFILCNTYAYQESFAVIYTDELLDHKLLSFTAYMTPTETFEDKTPIGLEYDPQAQTFLSYVKGNGSVDCGSIGEYKWNKASKEADLVEYQLQECDKPTQSPWPIVFP